MKNTEEHTPSTDLPVTVEGVTAFLAGPWVEGIGPAYARRLTESFGTDAIRVLADEPERAESIPGLGKARIATASESLRRIPYPAPLAAFLLSCGVSDMYVQKIFGKYRKRAAGVVTSDP